MEIDSEFSSCDMPESMTQYGSSGPHNLPLEYLRNITNNFSDERLLGEGGFGTVYKGVLPNGETIAVKKLNSSMPGVKDRQFENEAYHLMRLRHPNIVLLVGWCSETEDMYVEYNGKYICAEKSERLLCLEYMPKGNLRGYLSDESSGLTWETRYKIIKGICYGLHYLHEERQLNCPINHMDLKPANILLDNNMVPKIADFGMSRLFSEEKTWTCTISRDGTLGYMAPEYINRGLISTKSDIFSLGVIIIEIVAGRRDYPDESETKISSQEFTELVLKNWRDRLQKSLRYTSQETDYQQIRRCIQIGLDCVKLDRCKRPTISQVIKMLHGTESADFSGREEVMSLTNELSRVMTQQRSGPSSFKDPAEEFTVAQLEAATKGFALEAKIGEGSFGTVYKGKLPDGREVSIKRACGESGPRARRFQEKESAFRSELAFLSRLHHKHLVGLVGYCEENDERLLVYKYMKNGALYDHLHPKPAGSAAAPSPVASSWKLRIKILLDASRGIEYLHSYAVPPIIHRDIKSSNILLDGGWTARVSDFGLSLMGPLELSSEDDDAATAARSRSSQSQHLTVMKPAGTVGYMDPEYYGLRHLTVKSDVYSFGVVMLEVLTGKRAIFREAEGASPLSAVDYAVPSIVSGELGKVLDPRVPDPDAHETEAVELVAYTAVHCVRLEGKDRPAMADIVANLETAYALCEGNCEGIFDDDLVESPYRDSFPVSTVDQD